MPHTELIRLLRRLQTTCEPRQLRATTRALEIAEAIGHGTRPVRLATLVPITLPKNAHGITQWLRCSACKLRMLPSLPPKPSEFHTCGAMITTSN